MSEVMSQPYLKLVVESSNSAPSTKLPPASPVSAAPVIVAFDRHELRHIMNVYGRQVAAGEWKDYAINFTTTKAIFSIYRRASEHPLFRVEKDPKLAKKQGLYAVIAMTGQILKRGHDLERVMAVIDRRLKTV